MKNRILYVEDDEELGKLVERNLCNSGYEVIWLKSGNGMDDFLEKADIVVLDIMLPGLDGFTIGQRIKEKKIDIPILFLTARTAIEDKLKGLEFADDYLTKPFHPKELLLRIENLLKRFDKKNINLYNVKHLKVDLEANEIINLETEQEIVLTEKQFNIFKYFLKNSNQILTKEQIYSSVWNDTYIEGDKTVTVHINYLRKKIEKNPQNPEIIETIRGLGYRVRL